MVMKYYVLILLYMWCPRVGLTEEIVSPLDEAEWMILQDGIQRGDPDAFVAMGDQWVYGPEDRRDIRKGMELWAKAGLKNDPDALCRLAEAMETGVGMKSDPLRAMGLWFRASEAGSPAAKRRIALDYLSGTNLKKDPLRGIALLRQAADLGDPEAMYQLACHLEKGIPIQRDIPGAVRLYHLAAEAGCAAAQNDLGVLLASENNRASRLEAWIWFRRAADGGDSRAEKNLREMEHSMSFFERRSAKKLLRSQEASGRTP